MRYLAIPLFALALAGLASCGGRSACCDKPCCASGPCADCAKCCAKPAASATTSAKP